MPRKVPEALAKEVALIEAAVRPHLEALGAEHVEVVAAGTPSQAKYWIGYRLRPGVVRTAREMNEAASLHFPGAVSFFMQTTCKVEDLPDFDPELLAAQREIRRLGPWRWLVLGGAGLAVLTIFLGPLLFGRGELVASAGLHAAGTTTVAFEVPEDGLTLWASLDGGWTGAGHEGSATRNDTLPIHYEVDLVQGGRVVHHLAVDTQGPRLVEKRYCTMAPDCEILLMELPPLGRGPAELRVVARPRADVTHVDDMSLNVRRATFF